jgi:hypothetical protein
MRKNSKVTLRLMSIWFLTLDPGHEPPQNCCSWLSASRVADRQDQADATRTSRLL